MEPQPPVVTFEPSGQCAQPACSTRSELASFPVAGGGMTGTTWPTAQAPSARPFSRDGGHSVHIRALQLLGLYLQGSQGSSEGSLSERYWRTKWLAIMFLPRSPSTKHTTNYIVGSISHLFSLNMLSYLPLLWLGTR